MVVTHEMLYSDALVTDINKDISEAEKQLEDPLYLNLKSHKFFSADGGMTDD